MTLNLFDQAFLAAANGVPWTPAQVSTAIWLDADDNSTTFTTDTGSTLSTNNSDVGRWEDKSGNTRNILQSVSSARAVYLTNTINGRAVVSFGTSNFLRTSATFWPGTQYSAFGVIKPNGGWTATADYHYLFDFNNTPTAGNAVVIGCPTALDWVAGDILAFGAGYNSNPRAIGTTTSGTDSRLLTVAVGGTASLIAINGSALTLRVSATGSDVDSGAAFTVGCNGGNFQFLDGYIGELILTGSYSLAEREKFEGYLAHKWGLASSLPSSHTYRYSPPTI